MTEIKKIRVYMRTLHRFERLTPRGAREQHQQWLDRLSKELELLRSIGLDKQLNTNGGKHENHTGN